MTGGVFWKMLWQNLNINKCFDVLPGIVSITFSFSFVIMTLKMM